MNNEINYNDNPLSIIRQLPVIEVKITDIVSKKNFKEDTIFSNKYTQYLKGKLSLYATRVMLDHIQAGFYKRVNNKFKHFIDSYLEKDVNSIINQIRLGDRPALYIYHNINKSNPAKFLCPDDTVVYEAYKRLEIKMVPVFILGSPYLAEESSLEMQQFTISKKNYISYVTSLHTFETEFTTTLIGTTLLEHNKCFTIFHNKLKEVKEKLKLFHNHNIEIMHYHHTLYYTLMRAEEILKSIELLFNQNLYIDAASLSRNLYELMLTFYFDWISPSQSHLYLQIASLASKKEWDDICNNDLLKYKEHNLSEEQTRNLYKAQRFGFNLASNVAEKARLFPLADNFHSNVYSFLSKISHQDISITTRYKSALIHGDESIFNKDLEDKIVRYCDIFISQIVIRIENDIGIE
jgi:hypothetical protein